MGNLFCNRLARPGEGNCGWHSDGKPSFCLLLRQGKHQVFFNNRMPYSKRNEDDSKLVNLTHPVTRPSGVSVINHTP